MATNESVNWWNSPSGKDFQTQLKNEIGKDKVENKDFLLFIFDKTGIATSVAKKWMEGGNPSIVNIENILLHCPKCNTFKTQDIVESLRVWKMQHNPKVIAKINNGVTRAVKHDPESDVMTVLKAIITKDQTASEEKWWVRVYDHEGKRFIYGDRTSFYDYGPKMINTQKFREKVIEKLGHNKFTIVFDANASEPKW